MGEAFLVKSPGGVGIPVDPMYCTVVATVTDGAGNPVKDAYVVCNDGGQILNYTTNQKGQTYFTVSASSINLTATNIFTNGDIAIDHVNHIKRNISTKLGTIVNVNIPLAYIGNTNWYNAAIMPARFVNKNGNYIFLSTKYVDIILAGGGGGGGGFSVNLSSNSQANDICNNAFNSNNCAGGGGGGGELVMVNDFAVNNFESFYAQIGIGGNRGGWGLQALDSGGHRVVFNDPASTGGTTSVFSYSAVGGAGGYASNYSGYTYGAGGTGGGSGIGKGGTGATMVLNATNSSMVSNINERLGSMSILWGYNYFLNDAPGGLWALSAVKANCNTYRWAANIICGGGDSRITQSNFNRYLYSPSDIGKGGAGFVFYNNNNAASYVEGTSGATGSIIFYNFRME